MKMPIIVKSGTTASNRTGSWRTLKPKFLHDLCTACSICERFCPEGVIHQTEMTNAKGKKYFDCDLTYCKGCSLCAIECPFKAIIMEVDEK